MKPLTVAIVGATGAVGQTMLRVLQQRDFPVARLHALASRRSAGRTVDFSGRKIPVQELETFDFDGVDLALFSAGGAVSRAHAPRAAGAGALVVDNTSVFRMERDVPLVVPEVNPESAEHRPRGIIANPNCSTIQMVVALAPLEREFGIERIVVSTYQAVSGAGTRAVSELTTSTSRALKNEPYEPVIFPRHIAFNCLPQIGDFEADGYTAEEHKMMDETRKIFGDSRIGVSATCVRVPALNAHAESVNVTLRAEATLERVTSLVYGAKGVEQPNPSDVTLYPTQRDSSGQDGVFVGRIRKDPSHPRAFDFWLVADNLRKGAALNAVQISELVFLATKCK